MRLRMTILAILASCAGMSAAYADTLPVGTYTLLAQTTNTGIHQSIDQGGLIGTITFAANSQVTSANLLFQDLTDGLSFTFTLPGATTYTPQDHLLSATITNALDANTAYFFSISTVPSGGVYRLTCGVDCATDVIIPDATGRTRLNEEVFGSLTPTPEPSTFALLGTGLLGFGCVVRAAHKSMSLGK